MADQVKTAESKVELRFSNINGTSVLFHRHIFLSDWILNHQAIRDAAKVLLLEVSVGSIA